VRLLQQALSGLKTTRRKTKRFSFSFNLTSSCPNIPVILIIFARLFANAQPILNYGVPYVKLETASVTSYFPETSVPDGIAFAYKQVSSYLGRGGADRVFRYQTSNGLGAELAG